MPIVNIPGAGLVQFPDDMSDKDIGIAIRQDVLPKVQKEGFGAGFGAGIQGLKSAYYGGKYGLTGSEEDRKALLESQAKEAEKYQGPGWEDVKEAFAERGLLHGLGRTWEAAKGTAGQSLPYLAAPVAATVLAPEAAIAGVGLGTLGFLGTSAAQYTGTNMSRQVQEQEAAIKRGETPQELSLGKAALASIPAALLDRFALGQTFKGTGLGKLFGQEGREGIESVARQIVESGTSPSKIKSILAGGARGVGAEIPNEVGQQILERAQAGLDLTSDDAIREYKEAAFGATLLGGGLGGVSGISSRSSAIKTAKGWEERAADETAAFDKKEAERLKAMETTKTSILDTIRAANEKEAQRLQWQGDIREVGSAALDRSLSMFDTPEGIDTMMGNMEEYFPGMPKKDLAQYKIQLRTYKQRLIAQQKADAARAQESAFTQETPDVFGEFRPAPSIQEAIERPEFQLEAQEQAPQMELDLGQPQAATTAAPATIDDKYLRGFGLDKRSATYKALMGKDLNNPADVAEVRNIINGVLEGKATNTQAKVDEMVRTDPRLQEQPELAGFPTEEELNAEQAAYDQSQAEAARAQRNQGLAQLLASLETENAAKEEAAQAAAEAGQPSAGVPSEVGVQNQPVGLEPSVDVYDTTGGQGAAADRGIGGGALGPVGQATQERVENAGAAGNTLDLAQLIAEAEADADKQIAEEQAARAAEEKAMTDEQAKWDALLKAEGMGAEIEPIPTEEYETDAEAKARKKKERAEERAQTGELTGELSWDTGEGYDNQLTQNAFDVAPEVAERNEEFADMVANGANPRQLLQYIINNPDLPSWMRNIAKAVAKFKLPTTVEMAIINPIDGKFVAGTFQADTDRLFLHPDGPNLPQTFLHEYIHALTVHALNAGSSHPAAKKIINLFNKYNTVAAKTGSKSYGFTNAKEFVAEALSNPEFQAELRAMKVDGVIGKLWNTLKEAVRGLLGLHSSSMDVIDQLLDATLSAPEGRAELAAQAKPETVPQTIALDAADLFNQAGGFTPTAATTRILNKVKSTIDAFSSVEKLVNKINDTRTRVFSSDTKFNARVRNALQQSGLDWKNMMLVASTSQALHRGGLAERFLEWGTLSYDKATNRWESKEDDTNVVSMGKKIRAIADQMGADPVAVKGWVGEAWVAKRLENIGKEITNLEKEIDAFASPKTAAQREYQANRKEKLELLQRVAELRTPEQLAAGLKLHDAIGAENMRVLTGMKNTMRERVLQMLVDTQVMTKEKAETFLENAEWVPFYRVTAEDENIGGPAVLNKGLTEQMKEKKLKGATGADDTKQISGVDNLVKWLDWSVRRAVANQQKLVMVDTFKSNVADEIHEGKGDRGYTISVMEDGREKFYHFDDPLIAEAFTGMLPVMVPGMKTWRAATEGLRKSVTRFPLFPVAQIVQDTYDAMYTSGLKHPTKLISQVLSEVYKTYKGESTARKTLLSRGILSRDYSAAAEQEAAEVLAGLKDQNWWEKVNYNLEKFSSTADHIVRQAVYNQAKAEGLSDLEATEKATEIINFRRQGSATWVNWMRTMVPFFGAYLQVQNVALKTLSGEGISPTERKAALATLAMTAAKVALFSSIYSMMMGDDDDYKGMDRRTRDRMILIPGTDVGISIRPNVFATPKIFAEHAYGYLTDNGTTDGTKMRAAAKAALVDSVLPSSYAVPQLVRPALEVAMDHNIFLDRPIVGNLKNLEKYEQFTSSTSELAKLLGSSPLSPLSPVQWDHMLRGYFSSVGTMTLLATNDAIAAASGRPRPDRSWQDTINSIPNMGNFVAKEFGSGDKTDFYELAGEVGKVNDTVNRLQNQGRGEEIEGYLTEEKQQLLALKKPVANVQKQLTAIRKQKNQVLQSKEMTGDEKRVAIQELNEAERDVLKGRVKELREAAGF